MKRTIMVTTLGLFLGMNLIAEPAYSAWWRFWEKEAEAETEVRSQKSEDRGQRTEVKEGEEGTETTEEKGTQTVEVQTIEPKPVVEYEFDEPIVDVIFAEATMTVSEARALGMRGLEQRKATETVKVPYPRVIITKKAVKFLDNKGKILKNIPKGVDQQVEVSLKTGKIMIDGWSTEGGHKCMKLIDEKGTLIKEVKGGEFFGALMSENGQYIIAGEGTFVLYDIDGKELWKKNIGVDFNEGDIHILYDGKVVFVGEQYPDWKPKISVVNLDGSIAWKHNLPDGHYDYELFSTRDGKVLLYTDDHKYSYVLYGFDEKGNLLWQPKEYKGFDNSFHKLSVSKNANCLTGLTLWVHLWVMDIDTGEFIWKYPLKGWKPKGYNPNLLQISSDGGYVLIDGFVLLDGKTGKLLKKIEKGWKFLDSDKIWRKRGDKIEIINISDILK